MTIPQNKCIIHRPWHMWSACDQHVISFSIFAFTVLKARCTSLASARSASIGASAQWVTGLVPMGFDSVGTARMICSTNSSSNFKAKGGPEMAGMAKAWCLSNCWHTVPGKKMQKGSSILNPSRFWTLLNDLAHDLLQVMQRVICRHRLTVRTNSDALSALSTGHSYHRFSFRA